MRNCSVGDAALTLVDCEGKRAGSVVELVQRIDVDHLFVGEDRPFFAAEAGWVVRYREGCRAFLVDRFLMPLRGIPDSELAQPPRAGSDR